MDDFESGVALTISLGVSVMVQRENSRTPPVIKDLFLLVVKVELFQNSTLQT